MFSMCASVLNAKNIQKFSQISENIPEKVAGADGGLSRTKLIKSVSLVYSDVIYIVFLSNLRHECNNSLMNFIASYGRQRTIVSRQG